MNQPEYQNDRTLQSGRKVAQFDEDIGMTVSSQCPDKWLFVDLETGDVWHKREGEFDMGQGSFWRHATKEELQELKKLKVQ